MNSELLQIYGNTVRLRVCGVCIDVDKILMVQHHSLNDTEFWAPPGGGIEFSQTLEENLKREFLEETGLAVRVGKFLFGCEFLRLPLHSVELFFEVFQASGTLTVGTDPELPIIKDVRFCKLEELKRLKESELHGIFKKIRSLEDFWNLDGFHRI